MARTVARDHGLWLFDLAHGNLKDPEVLQGFIQHYVLEGKSLDNVMDDLVFRTSYGIHYTGEAMDQLKAVLEKTAEGRC